MTKLMGQLALVTAIVAILAVNSAQATIVASWDFEEGSGTTVGDGVGGLHATQTGGTWTTLGDFNGALGTSLQLVRSQADTVLAPYAGELSALTSMTVETWVRYTGGIPNYGIARLFEMPGVDLFYYVDGDVPGGLGGLRVGTGGVYTGYDLGNLTLDGWTHVVVTYNDGTGTINLYRNGVLTVSAGGGTGLALGGSGSIGLGNSSAGTGIFDGAIDHYSIHDVALSGSEVLDRYNAVIDFIPEPASVTLLAMGGLLVLRRRQR